MARGLVRVDLALSSASLTIPTACANAGCNVCCCWAVRRGTCEFRSGILFCSMRNSTRRRECRTSTLIWKEGIGIGLRINASCS
eukprot:7391747-Prymnesium_polylepis.2